MLLWRLVCLAWHLSCRGALAAGACDGSHSAGQEPQPQQRPTPFSTARVCKCQPHPPPIQTGPLPNPPSPVQGFSATLNAIVANIPRTRQTLLFSATQTKSVKDLARLSLKVRCCRLCSPVNTSIVPCMPASHSRYCAAAFVSPTPSGRVPVSRSGIAWRPLARHRAG